MIAWRRVALSLAALSLLGPWGCAPTIDAGSLLTPDQLRATTSAEEIMRARARTAHLDGWPYWPGHRGRSLAGHANPGMYYLWLARRRAELEGVPPERQAKLERGEIEVGMTERDVAFAWGWGWPSHAERWTTPQGRWARAEYRSTATHFEREILYLDHVVVWWSAREIRR